MGSLSCVLEFVFFFSVFSSFGPYTDMTRTKGDGSPCTRCVFTCMWTTQKLAGPILRDFLFLPLKISHFLSCPIPFYYENQKTLIILLLSFHPETQCISHFGISPLLTFGGPGFSASGFYTPTFGKLSYLYVSFHSQPCFLCLYLCPKR